MKLPDLHPARRAFGVARSLVIYYGKPFQARRMARFYAQFIRPGDLCFDIGAHVGNRLAVWRRLGGRVVGVEPQPQCMRLLRRLYGQTPGVTLVEEAVGAAPGVLPMWVSEANPTVSSLSPGWIQAVQQVDSFAGVRWEASVPVVVATLDDLIDRFGEPVFCKIDVEGFEGEVLAGLTRPLPALSFEMIPATQALTFGCLGRLAALGDYRYNWSLGEQHRWQSPRWLTQAEMVHALRPMDPSGPSGDIYARRQDMLEAA